MYSLYVSIYLYSKNIIFVGGKSVIIRAKTFPVITKTADIALLPEIGSDCRWRDHPCSPAGNVWITAQLLSKDNFWDSIRNGMACRPLKDSGVCSG